MFFFCSISAGIRRLGQCGVIWPVLTIRQAFGASLRLVSGCPPRGQQDRKALGKGGEMGMTQSGKAYIGCNGYDCCEGRARLTGLRMPHRRQSLLALIVFMLSGLSLSVPAHVACSASSRCRAALPRLMMNGSSTAAPPSQPAFPNWQRFCRARNLP